MNRQWLVRGSMLAALGMALAACGAAGLPGVNRTPQAVACSAAPTRTPPPGQPTRAPSGPPVDPHIEICAGGLAARTATIKVGETITVTGKPVDIGLPYYDLLLDGKPVVEVQYGGQVRMLGSDNRLEVVSAQGAMQEATFVLRGRAPGTVRTAISATGEVHYGYPGPAMYEGGGSDTVEITISQ